MHIFLELLLLLLLLLLLFLTVLPLFLLLLLLPLLLILAKLSKKIPPNLPRVTTSNADREPQLGLGGTREAITISFV